MKRDVYGNEIFEEEEEEISVQQKVINEIADLGVYLKDIKQRHIETENRVSALEKHEKVHEGMQRQGSYDPYKKLSEPELFHEALQNIHQDAGSKTIVQAPTLDQIHKYDKAFAWYLKFGGTSNYPPDWVQKDLQIGIDPLGGYLINPRQSFEIIETIKELDPIRELASIDYTSTDAIEYPVSDIEDICEGGWIQERQSRPVTASPRINKKRIGVNTVYARPAASLEFTHDYENVENWLTEIVGNKFGRIEGEAFLAGDGIGKPRGLLSYDSGTDWGQVEQISLGGDGIITPDGLKNLIAGLKEQHQSRAVLLMNRTTKNYIEKLKTGEGQYVFWQNPNDPSSSRVWGTPIRTAPSMPTIASASLSVIVADFKRAYRIVDRLGMTVIVDRVTTPGMVYFHFYIRTGGDVLNYEALKIGICS